MHVASSRKMPTVADIDVKGKTVLVRLDINSPLDTKTKKIVNQNRIEKSIPTLRLLIEKEAKIAVLAHQGDSLDYHNVIPLEEHRLILAKLLNTTVYYIDDVCGEAARKSVKQLQEKEIIILGNARYLSEEMSTFENSVVLSASEMQRTWLYRQLAPLVDFYVNDAFSAAHRNSPSMVAFQESIPTVAGEQYYTEFETLSRLLDTNGSAVSFILGGAKVSDAFGMIDETLHREKATIIMTAGVVGMIFLAASGVPLGQVYTDFLRQKGLLEFIDIAAQIMSAYPGKICLPDDVAFQNSEGHRQEITVDQMERVNKSYLDVGKRTIEQYKSLIEKAEMLFMNGPAGVYENSHFEYGTSKLFKAVSESKAFSVIGGGDTVSAASKYIDLRDINYVSTAGGAMIQFLSGKHLPLIESMNRAFERFGSEMKK